MRRKSSGSARGKRAWLAAERAHKRAKGKVETARGQAAAAKKAAGDAWDKWAKMDPSKKSTAAAAQRFKRAMVKSGAAQRKLAMAMQAERRAHDRAVDIHNRTRSLTG